MSLRVNLRHLEAHSLKLQGEVTIGELDIDTRDEMIQIATPLEYDLQVEKLEHGLLLEGDLRMGLHCKCVRCLKEFEFRVELRHWRNHVALEGEEAAPVINDLVDLTPFMREDILLAFPQHPLCERECRGLPKQEPGKAKASGGGGPTEASSSAWAELNKLKF